MREGIRGAGGAPTAADAIEDYLLNHVAQASMMDSPRFAWALACVAKPGSGVGWARWEMWLIAIRFRTRCGK